ncbi:tyrosine-protein phosphatase [Rhizobium wuzhouense]|uniref:protein-tyrosine-phosphatase n=1 Tax=Rhizobium wuzhouense TaxID=1986026 RepID=A0ABX5NN55_9HYPH|nr:CpsB/CapC family capsule biosynthesis tyrosine phosphatase [Rhizobium wuzhouense]PYB71698.1 capsular biosynthesis protein [Rhizobium wuzhouense]
MIDLHSHILFGLDDGASELDISIEMARIAVADGITHMACTPHVQEGVYPNDWATIRPVLEVLQQALRELRIPLTLFCGAEAHLAWDLPERLLRGDIPTLNDSRYFLLELPHLVVPPRLQDFVLRLKDAGFIPVITHPERLSWAERRPELLVKIAELGCPLQLTADSLLGRFGMTAQAQAASFVDAGLLVFVASDAHSPRARAPRMSAAMKLVASRWGEETAQRMFIEIPQIILSDGMLPDAARQHLLPRRPMTSGSGVGRLLTLLRAGL